MGNVLSKAKRDQVIALGRLGSPLRRIEQATGVRREAAGDYLCSAGIVLRSPGSWGQKSLANAVTSVTTDSGDPQPSNVSKPAVEVTTDSGLTVTLPEQDSKRSVSSCAAYRELIALELPRAATRWASGRTGRWARVYGWLPIPHRTSETLPSRNSMVISLYL
jgi:hypothetical protein